ncbi:hypothetical protein QBC36DRAFT_345576 [Triangularia setosa]|uniref:Zn(2)-C6 fungal-type domain-containing protein n=1 Tax=Triangularia setosa TaxID=2587417 RepID=A0AAN6W8F5_9PEZI|nr:hypothetical protein QBC36DRAFT_345576 [Podospora setosa]
MHTSHRIWPKALQTPDTFKSRPSLETPSVGPPSDCRALPPRRSSARKACVYCKAKKIRCNGGEPCSQCQFRQHPRECHYERRDAALRKRSAPGTDPPLCSKSSSAVVYSSVSPYSLSRQASADPEKEYMLQSYARLTLANELVTRYTSIYPALIHLDAEHLSLQVKYDPDRLLAHINAIHLHTSANLQDLHPLSDNRRQRLDPTQWNDVLIRRDLAASLPSQYFVNDHAAFHLFDVDLFLDNLAAYGGHLYCSSQLINALLAWTCQAYYGLYPEKALQELSVHLLNGSTITSAPTATLLEVYAMILGRSVHGLFGAGDSLSTGAIVEPTGMALSSSQWTKASFHTAWGVFSNQKFIDLQFRSCAFQGPLMLPIPGRDAYKLDDSVLSILPRPSSTTISYLYYYTGESDDGSPLATLPNKSPNLEQAESIFRRLFLWTAGLPLDCMHFYAAGIAMFQPLIFGPLQRLTFPSFNTQGSALCAFNSSVDQLKRLVINHRSTFKLQENLIGPLRGSIALASSLCQTGSSMERKDDSLTSNLVVDSELALTDPKLGDLNISDRIEPTTDVDHVVENDRMELE